MKLEEYRHIVIEGPIGVGKTSLAKRMASHLRGELLLEKPGDNPFLERFYEDMRRYALPTQLFFLFQRADQLKGLVQADMFAKPIVSDTPNPLTVPVPSMTRRIDEIIVVRWESRIVPNALE